MEYFTLVDGEVLENVEVNKEISELSSYLKGNIENIVKDIKSVDDILFIQKWIKPLVNIEI